MEIVYSCCITFIVVIIILNYILNKKMEKQINALINENEILMKKTIKQTQVELEIKETLALAEKTHEFAIHTVQKIKKLIN